MNYRIRIRNSASKNIFGFITALVSSSDTCDKNNNVEKTPLKTKQKAEAINPENFQRFTTKDKLFNTWCLHLNSCQCFCPSNMAHSDVKKTCRMSGKIVAVNFWCYTCPFPQTS